MIHRLPLFQGEFLQRHRWGIGAGVVEDHVEAAEAPPGLGEEFGDRVRISDVAGHAKAAFSGLARQGQGLVQSVLAAAGQGDAVAVFEKGGGHRAADTAARSGDDRDLAVAAHAVLP